MEGGMVKSLENKAWRDEVSTCSDHSSHQEESEVGWAFVLQVSVVGPGAVWRERVLDLSLTGCVAQVLLWIVRPVMPRRVGVGDAS